MAVSLTNMEKFKTILGSSPTDPEDAPPTNPGGILVFQHPGKPIYAMHKCTALAPLEKGELDALLATRKIHLYFLEDPTRFVGGAVSYPARLHKLGFKECACGLAQRVCELFLTIDFLDQNEPLRLARLFKADQKAIERRFAQDINHLERVYRGRNEPYRGHPYGKEVQAIRKEFKQQRDLLCWQKEDELAKRSALLKKDAKEMAERLRAGSLRFTHMDSCWSDIPQARFQTGKDLLRFAFVTRRSKKFKRMREALPSHPSSSELWQCFHPCRSLSSPHPFDHL